MEKAKKSNEGGILVLAFGDAYGASLGTSFLPISENRGLVEGYRVVEI